MVNKFVLVGGGRQTEFSESFSPRLHLWTCVLSLAGYRFLFLQWGEEQSCAWCAPYAAAGQGGELKELMTEQSENNTRSKWNRMVRIGSQFNKS